MATIYENRRLNYYYIGRKVPPTLKKYEKLPYSSLDEIKNIGMCHIKQRLWEVGV